MVSTDSSLVEDHNMVGIGLQLMVVYKVAIYKVTVTQQ